MGGRLPQERGEDSSAVAAGAMMALGLTELRVADPSAYNGTAMNSASLVTDTEEVSEDAPGSASEESDDESIRRSRSGLHLLFFSTRNLSSVFLLRFGIPDDISLGFISPSYSAAPYLPCSGLSNASSSSGTVSSRSNLSQPKFL